MKASLSRPSRQHKLADPIRSPIPDTGDEIAVARAICEDFAGGAREGGGIPKVAERIGMPAGVLYNKTSGAEGSHHKLTVQDFKLIHLATGRIEHLQALARSMNCVAFPVPDFSRCSDQALLELLAKVHEECGQYHHLLRHCLQDGQIEAEELAQLEREVFEWVGAIVEAHARVKGLARG